MRKKLKKVQEKLDTADQWLAERPLMDCLFGIARVAAVVGLVWVGSLWVA